MLSNTSGNMWWNNNMSVGISTDSDHCLNVTPQYSATPGYNNNKPVCDSTNIMTNHWFTTHAVTNLKIFPQSVSGVVNKSTCWSRSVGLVLMPHTYYMMTDTCTYCLTGTVLVHIGCIESRSVIKGVTIQGVTIYLVAVCLTNNLTNTNKHITFFRIFIM